MDATNGRDGVRIFAKPQVRLAGLLATAIRLNSVPMVIGVLQIELVIDGSESLKDKRRVVKSLKDRLHREHYVAVAEVDRQEAHQIAVLGIAAISNSGAHAQGMLDRILDQIRHDRSVVVNDQQTEIITGH